MRILAICDKIPIRYRKRGKDMERQKRNFSLDFLKILGTILIVFHHYQQYMDVKFPSGVNYFGGPFYFGYLVELFFLLSGFVAWHYIAQIQNGLTLERFFGKAWLRFAPFLVLGAIISGLLHGAYQYFFYEPFLNTSVSLWNILKAALGIHQGWMFAPQEAINGHTWYVSVLLLCYLIFWFLVRLSGKKEIPLSALFAGMTVLGIALLESKCTLPFFNGGDSRGYMSFFFGLLLARFWERRTPGRGCCLTCLGIVLLLTWLIAFRFDYVSDGLRYLMLYVYYPCLVTVCLSQSVRRLFRFPWLGTLAAISFNTYMWHGSILLALRIFANLRPGWLLLERRITMYAVTAMCFFCGTVSHYVLEKPHRAFLEKRASGAVSRAQ